MSAAAAIRRLSNEKRTIDENRVCDFYAGPLEEDIFEWHFTLQGPVDSPFANGLYHGALRFPRNYPFAPPDIIFFTRNGRFEVGKTICSSVSSYHPELWQPTYDISLVLIALRVFMTQDEEKGIGALTKRYVSLEDKMRMAEESHAFSCAKCGMSSAKALWETYMKGHPPVSPGLEAHVPKIPKAHPPTTTTATNDHNDHTNSDANEAEAVVSKPLDAVSQAESLDPTVSPLGTHTSSAPLLSQELPVPMEPNPTTPSTQTPAEVKEPNTASHAMGEWTKQMHSSHPTLSTMENPHTREMEQGEKEVNKRQAAAHTSLHSARPTGNTTQNEVTLHANDTPTPHATHTHTHTHTTTTTTTTTDNSNNTVTVEESSPAVVPQGGPAIRLRVAGWVLWRVEVKQLDRAINVCFSICVAVLLKKCILA